MPATKVNTRAALALHSLPRLISAVALRIIKRRGLSCAALSAGGKPRKKLLTHIAHTDNSNNKQTLQLQLQLPSRQTQIQILSMCVRCEEVFGKAALANYEQSQLAEGAN